MSPLAIGLAIALAFIIGAFIGIIGGSTTERSAWTMRADRHCSHYCDGEFYIIMTEKNFCENYRLHLKDLSSPTDE